MGYLPGEFKKVDPKGWSLREFKEVYSKWDAALDGKGWNALYLGNHDQPRMVSRWGDDRDEFRVVSAKLLFTFLLTMRGTPSLYNGDELGMTNIRFRADRGIPATSKLNRCMNRSGRKGGIRTEFLQDQQLAARDNGRTPFQWDGSLHAGFTTGEPWITVNKNYRVVNAAVQGEDADSVLAYVRRLVGLRQERKVLVYGEYRQLSAHELEICAYLRSDGSEQVLVLLNFSAKDQVFRGVGEGEVWISNYSEVRRDAEGVRLRPWQAVVLRQTRD